MIHELFYHSLRRNNNLLVQTYTYRNSLIVFGISVHYLHQPLVLLLHLKHAYLAILNTRTYYFRYVTVGPNHPSYMV